MNKLRTLIPWSKQRNIIQPLIRNANDCFLYDNKNRKIVDFTSGLMVVNLGHNNQYIKNGIKEHINNGIAYIPSSFATYEREKLSDRLISISNMNQGKVFYTNGGADSNETAIFLSLETNSTEKKKRIISFAKSYHGGSSYITSLIGGDNRRENKNNHYSSKNLKLEPIIPNPCLKEDGKTTIEFIENNPVSIKLPEHITEEVIDTEAVIKGQTAASSFKPATLSNGYKIMVPPHIENGTRIVISTTNFSYLEKAKD